MVPGWGALGKIGGCGDEGNGAGGPESAVRRTMRVKRVNHQGVRHRR